MPETSPNLRSMPARLSVRNLVLRCTLAVLVCGFLFPPIARAEEDTAELRARIERLEREQQELQALLPPPPAVVPAQGQEVPTLDFTGASTTPVHCEGDGLWSNLDLKGKWNHGLEISTSDGAFRVHVGGRTQFDSAWFGTDDRVQQRINIPYGSGVDFRRARLRVDGTMYHDIEWAVEYDFVNSARTGNTTNDGFTDFDVTALTDMWWTFKNLPILGNVRVGNQKEPIGFEHLVSSRFLPFMERSFNQDAFYGGFFNGFTPGISAFDNYSGERGLWQIGLYKPTDNVFAFNTNSGDYAVTGRLTYLPIYEDEGRKLLHLGFAVRASSTINNSTRFRTRDAIRSGVSSTWPVPADTGSISADHQQFLDAELAAILGPWTFQSEYLVAFIQDATRPGAITPGQDLTYHGGYLQLLYFLTGESDHYNPKTAVFERVTPHRNAFRLWNPGERGIGAWQVGARYNYLNLNSQGINGGILNNFSGTLNWFLNPNMKVQFDYSATHRNAPFANGAGDGWVHGWGIRMAQDF